MPEMSSKVECPDCGQPLLTKNLSKHYRRYHPGVDPRLRLRESHRRKPKRIRFDTSVSPMIVSIIVILVLAVLIIGGLITYRLLNPVETIPESRRFFFSSSDGAIINGTFYGTYFSGAPTVYLFHDIGQDRSVWDDHARYLQEKGFNAVAVDLRGHGESVMSIKSASKTYDHMTMTHREFLNMSFDLFGAYEWVQGSRDGKRNTDAGKNGMVVATGELGAIIFDQAAKMSRQWIVAGAVLTPVLEAYGIDMYQVSWDWGGIRPLMLVTSQYDGTSKLSLEKMADNRPENSRTILIEDFKSGYELMEFPLVRTMITETFNEGIRVSPG
ncbi:MAG: hypothetical protein QCI82_00190 [Candidatus Thermoplasmatota archaeon]|nr:hypothetical protein [Candidatus Thermoplasmatota archaeon]